MALLRYTSTLIIFLLLVVGCSPKREHLTYAEQMKQKKALYNAMSKTKQIEAVKAHWWRIAFIDNPSYAVQKVAMDHSNGAALGEIKNPTKEIELQAVRQIMKDGSFNILLTKKISSFSEEAQIEAVKINPQIIKFIPYPSPKVQLEAVKKNPYVVKNIINATEEAKQEAIRLNPRVKRFLRK